MVIPLEAESEKKTLLEDRHGARLSDKTPSIPKKVRKIVEKIIFFLVFPLVCDNTVWRGVGSLAIHWEEARAAGSVRRPLGLDTVPLWGGPGRAPGEDSVERGGSGYTGEGARSMIPGVPLVYPRFPSSIILVSCLFYFHVCVPMNCS